MPSSLSNLENALESLSLDCEPSKIDLLHEYIELLFKWHEKNNIVSTRDKKYFIQRDMFIGFYLTFWYSFKVFPDF